MALVSAVQKPRAGSRPRARVDHGRRFLGLDSVPSVGRDDRCRAKLPWSSFTTFGVISLITVVRRVDAAVCFYLIQSRRFRLLHRRSFCVTTVIFLDRCSPGGNMNA